MLFNKIINSSVESYYLSNPNFIRASDLNKLIAEHPNLYEKFVKPFNYGDFIYYSLLRFGVALLEKLEYSDAQIPELDKETSQLIKAFFNKDLHDQLLSSTNPAGADLAVSEGNNYRVFAQFIDMAIKSIQHGTGIEPLYFLHSKKLIFFAKNDTVNTFENYQYLEKIFKLFSTLLDADISINGFLSSLFENILLHYVGELCSEKKETYKPLETLESLCDKFATLLTKTPSKKHPDFYYNTSKYLKEHISEGIRGLNRHLQEQINKLNSQTNP